MVWTDIWMEVNRKWIQNIDGKLSWKAFGRLKMRWALRKLFVRM
jgi:hypothetical protein